MAPPCCACPTKVTAWRESITLAETGVPMGKSGLGESTRAASCDACACSKLAVAGGRPHNPAPRDASTGTSFVTQAMRVLASEGSWLTWVAQFLFEPVYSVFEGAEFRLLRAQLLLGFRFCGLPLLLFSRQAFEL